MTKKCPKCGSENSFSMTYGTNRCLNCGHVYTDDGSNLWDMEHPAVVPEEVDELEELSKEDSQLDLYETTGESGDEMFPEEF
jgi:uncharacterized Zn finger protein